MKKNCPVISVVMVFYNAEQYIEEAVKSVLKQSFQDFEFLLIDDGSKDQSARIVEKFKDDRIRTIHKGHDYIASLNYGLDCAQGKYIARMDADDIMHPDRLFVQYRLMEDKPWIDFCSSWCTFFEEKTGKKVLYNESSGVIKDPLVSLLHKNIFTHTTIIFKTEFLKKNNLKYHHYNYAEDYKMWVEAAKLGANFYIEPQSLLFYRCHEQQVSTTKSEEQRKTSFQIKEEIMDCLLPDLPKELKDFYDCLCNMEIKNMVKQDLKIAFISEILKQNKIMR